MTREQMRGPWAGLPVAWKDDDSFDEKTYREDVARCCEAGVPGVYTGGTTGEFYGQEIDEFERVAAATIKECTAAGTPVMIGCTSLSTRGAIRRAQFAAEKGADAIQVALPFWLEVPDAEIVPFFRAIADAVPGMPISIYETRRAKKALTLEQFRQIHREVPLVIHVKANAETLGHSVEGCKALSGMVSVFVGENMIHKLGPSGAIGSCSSLVYMNPRLMLRIFDLLFQKNWEELKVWTDKLDRIIYKGLKPSTDAGCEDSAQDRLLGLSAGFLKAGLRCRAPYTAATPEHLAQFRAWLARNCPEFLEL